MLSDKMMFIRDGVFTFEIHNETDAAFQSIYAALLNQKSMYIFVVFIFLDFVFIFLE